MGDRTCVRRVDDRVAIDSDEGKKLRKSHENSDVTRLYEELLGKPLRKLSHQLLHTHYHARSRV